MELIFLKRDMLYKINKAIELFKINSHKTSTLQPYNKIKMFQIWLVWATNVWKSTLFNRLIWQFRAIVTDIPGTTTDIIFHPIHVDGVGDVTFADSPGLIEFDEERSFIQKIIDESDLLLFVVDDSVGITAKEQKIYSYILDANKRKSTILIVNKLDINYKPNEIDLAVSDYYDLWIENIIWISAKQELNILGIKDFIEGYFKNKEWKTNQIEKEHPIWIAIIWKPNVGKSTLLNTLVGKKLAKVEDYLGTTRDYITWEFEFEGKKYKVYDTAWIRKKWSIHGIEKIAYDKIKWMLEYARPAVLFMIDWKEWITHRDMTLLAEINNLALPVIFVVNKMDMLDSKQKKSIQQKVQWHLDFAKYIPIMPIVATEWKWVKEVLRLIGDISIDVTFLGIGENSHIAFNDPPADFETKEPYLVVQLDAACRQQQLGEGWFPTIDDVPMQAISMSVNQIMKSKAIICSVPDVRKANAIKKTIDSPVSPMVPSSILKEHKATWLYLDKFSASLLSW